MKILRTTFIVFATWALWLVISQYFLCARYQFTISEPFEGPVIFNPYDSLNATEWVKCNFHAHAHAWNGATNGHGTANDVHIAYDSLKYGIHCVSNYHHIDTTRQTDRAYLPAYEHGYNTTKTHQLVLGSSNVRWLDYLLPQSVHNKQHVLDNLREWNAVTVLNHPGIRNGYTEDDLAQLRNYDCMEVLNPARTSTKQWDAALSAGKKVFIVGNDDTHDVPAGKRVGEMCTYVNVPDISGARTLEALRSGKSYGAVLGTSQHLDSVPFLKKLSVTGDSVLVEMSALADTVLVTGQSGAVLKTGLGTSSMRFRLRPEDRYARATFHYRNGTSIYLNPVFFTKPSGHHETSPFVDYHQTLLYRGIGVILMAGWLIFTWTFLGKNRRQRFGQRKLALK